MAAKVDKKLVIAGHELALTHLSKPYWPKEGITKGDLIEYYLAVATVMLPYLKNRPNNLHRFPEGVNGQGFYQKDMAKQAPEWAQTAKIKADDGHVVEYLVVNDEATLIYAANLGTIEFNPWNATVKDLDHPSWAVLDLDPEDIGFEAVVKVALAARTAMAAGGNQPLVKTSGGRGLHLFLPLDGSMTHEQSRELILATAKVVNAQLPDLTSLTRDPAKRQGKVYLDYLQNAHGQTLAAPYSARPKPGATVSAPLTWEELERGGKPTDFTVKTMPQRLAKVGDLWRSVLDN